MLPGVYLKRNLLADFANNLSDIVHDQISKLLMSN